MYPEALMLLRAKSGHTISILLVLLSILFTNFNTSSSLMLSFLQQYSPLLAAFTTQGQSELTLLLKIQEYCYDNIHFMKSFQKIVVLFYKGKLGSFWASSTCNFFFFEAQT